LLNLKSDILVVGQINRFCYLFIYLFIYLLTYRTLAMHHYVTVLACRLIEERRPINIDVYLW